MAIISKKSEKALNVFVSAGATIVIIGAWAKILHLPGASITLTIGLLTEALIFAVYAILSAKGYGLDDHAHGGVGTKIDIAPALLEKIGADQLKNLQQSIIKLNEIGLQLKSLSISAGATQAYNEQMTKAAKSFSEIGNLVGETVSSVSRFKKATDAISHIFPENQVADMKNMVNSMKNMTAFYTTVSEATEALKESVQEAKNTKQQMGTLTQNLSQLNAMYNNMITAMRSGGSK
ncbi:MAG: GldL-related protein [Chitinophagaceae bacterium]